MLARNMFTYIMVWTKIWGRKRRKLKIFYLSLSYPHVLSPSSLSWHWLFWSKLKCISDNLDCHFVNVWCCVFQKYFSHQPLKWEAKVQIAVIQIRLCIFDSRNVHFQHGTHRIKCTAAKTANENCRLNLVVHWKYVPSCSVYSIKKIH